MEWRDVEPEALFEAIRARGGAPDAERTVWAFERALTVARLDPELLRHLVVAAVCLVAYEEVDHDTEGRHGVTMSLHSEATIKPLPPSGNSDMALGGSARLCLTLRPPGHKPRSVSTGLSSYSRAPRSLSSCLALIRYSFFGKRRTIVKLTSATCANLCGMCSISTVAAVS